MRQQFEDRLNKIYPIVAAIPGFQLVKPQGAFTFSQTSGKQMNMCGYEDINNFVEAILEETGVAVVTGAGFGAPDNLRISYATDWATLEEAAKRLQDFVEKKAEKLKMLYGTLIIRLEKRVESIQILDAKTCWRNSTDWCLGRKQTIKWKNCLSAIT